MYLIGLDVGTTRCKAAVFDMDGGIRGYGLEELGILSVESAMVEQNAEEVWRVTCRVLRKAVGAAISSGINVGQLRALSLSVQGDAIIPLDRKLRTVHNAILGMDYRSHPQAETCAETFGAYRLFKLTGMRPHPINSLIKALWLKEQLPEVFRRTWKIATYADFILARLGAPLVIDFTMASRTMGFDLCRRAWSDDILSALDLSPDLFSTPTPSGTVVGFLSREAAEATSLPQGLSLVTGGHDQTCAALGAGIIEPGRGVVSTGTAEVLSTAFNRPVLNKAMFESYYPCCLYLKQGMYFTFSLNHVGGLLLRWYRDNIAYQEVAAAKAQGIEPYEFIFQKLPEEPSKLIILPHFNGSGTPWCDMKSKGAILGLTLLSTRHDIARAILESQSFELRINLQMMEKAGLVIEELIAVGGGARSPTWLQIKADILDRTIVTLKTQEAACLGAAILAGAATGVFHTLDEGVRRAVEVDKAYTPNEAHLQRYEERFQIYREVYPALAHINRRL